MAAIPHEGHGEEGEGESTPVATKRPLCPQTELWGF